MVCKNKLQHINFDRKIILKTKLFLKLNYLLIIVNTLINNHKYFIFQHLKDEEEWDEFYESENQRELRQIWQGQSQIFEHLRELSRKVDEVIGRQENTLSLVSRGMSGAAAVQGGAAGQQAPPMAGGAPTITRPEVDLIMQNQNNLLATIREIRSLVGDIQVRQQNAPTAQIQTGGYDMQSLIAEMRDGMNQVKQGMAHVGQK